MDVLCSERDSELSQFTTERYSGGHYSFMASVKVQYRFVTWHEKTVLMYTQNLTTFWTLNFNNSLSKYSVSMKHLLIL